MAANSRLKLRSSGLSSRRGCRRASGTSREPMRRLVATTGGPEDSYHPQGYNRYFFDAFLPPYEQTAALCGMRFLPPLLLHGAHRVSDAEVAAHVAVFRERLARYPQWPELDGMDSSPACEVPVTDRPAEES